MSAKIYPCFYPTLDRGRGRTRALLDELLEIHHAGAPDGAEEILSLVALLSDEELRPYINYLIVEKNPVAELMGAFAQFIADSQPENQRTPLSATGVASATGGLTAALLANDVAGGEVITTSLNFPGVPNAIVMAGAIPRFVDINEDDWCMNFDSLRGALNPSTRAIVLTHFNKAIEVGAIAELLDEKGLDIPLIQDASVAMGSTSGGALPGAANVGRGGATVYSFAISKVITGLGGGLVVSNDEALLKRINAIAYQGLAPDKPFEQVSIGANIKMNDLNAAIALAQFKRRKAIFDRRRLLRTTYDKELEGLEGKGLLSRQSLDHETIITHYAIALPNYRSIAQRLYERGGAILGHWIAGHLQPPFRKRFGTSQGTLPTTEKLAERIAFLPFYIDLTQQDIERICTTLSTILEG